MTDAPNITPDADPATAALLRAIDSFPSQAAFAKALGVTPMAVSQWKARRIPPERCRDIERVTNGKVTRRDLRPDLFGDDDEEPHQRPCSAHSQAAS